MKQTATIRLGIQSAALSPAIHVGQLSADETHFTEKIDMTNQVLHAVGQFVLDHHEGSLIGLLTLRNGKQVAMNIAMSREFEPGEHPSAAAEAGQGDQAVQDPS
jgi:hypothetical protein